MPMQTWLLSMLPLRYDLFNGGGWGVFDDADGPTRCSVYFWFRQSLVPLHFYGRGQSWRGRGAKATEACLKEGACHGLAAVWLHLREARIVLEVTPKRVLCNTGRSPL